MSDENRDVESGEAGFSALPSVGSQLKAAREKKEMSVGDIAMALKLGQRQVEALESGDWQRLPGHTFIRGFVRNYARLLQLDAAPLMTQLDAVLETPQQRLVVSSAPRATMPQAGKPRRRDYAMAMSGLALVAIAIGIYFLLPSDLSALRDDINSLVAMFASKEAPPAPAPAAPPAAASEPIFPPGSTPQQVMNPQATPVEPQTPAAAPAPAEAAPQPQAAAPAANALVPPPVLQAAPPAAPQAAPQAAAQAPAAPAGAALHFVFEQESWVEVRDRNGKLLLSQRNPAGTEQNINGQGPFSLVIGNAPGVKLSLRGQPVDLAPRTTGNVARLTLE